jgi:hypothetical protein
MPFGCLESELVSRVVDLLSAPGTTPDQQAVAEELAFDARVSPERAAAFAADLEEASLTSAKECMSAIEDYVRAHVRTKTAADAAFALASNRRNCLNADHSSFLSQPDSALVFRSFLDLTTLLSLNWGQSLLREAGSGEYAGTPREQVLAYMDSLTDVEQRRAFICNALHVAAQGQDGTLGRIDPCPAWHPTWVRPYVNETPPDLSAPRAIDRALGRLGLWPCNAHVLELWFDKADIAGVESTIAVPTTLDGGILGLFHRSPQGATMYNGSLPCGFPLDLLNDSSDDDDPEYELIVPHNPSLWLGAWRKAGYRIYRTYRATRMDVCRGTGMDLDIIDLRTRHRRRLSRLGHTVETLG